ncbi:hypothetical protein PGT21_025060 [Puccinia graminis f. sp. tritici]|uniref:Vacuolar ATPase assembly protein VMA22 n=1 Tax=Puccinia graminis f. sp. tritici TaxID=56615 RepID=A0A5B0RT05_PUCGR|nr:hypothetical protein PGT21_025060 [Puccinia graminis f. sp. tritici]KAA1129021.1 hypothetical protein PGTUg99_023805 [Puccinia graminis f. sp. tritici]
MARSTEFQLTGSLSKKWAANSANKVEVLDKYLLTYLNLLDDYNACHDGLQSHIQAAFLNLSKAKVVLGPSRIGPNSYDLSSRLPTKTIVIQNQDPIDPDEELDQSKGPFMLTLNRFETCPSVELKNDPSGCSSENGLRKRKNKQEPVSPEPGLPTEEHAAVQANSLPEKEDQDKDRPKELPNPIHQFAALPPPPLRSAQIGFSKTLESIVRLSNLRSVLIEIEKFIELQRQLVENQTNSDPPERENLQT